MEKGRRCRDALSRCQHVMAVQHSKDTIVCAALTYRKMSRLARTSADCLLVEVSASVCGGEGASAAKTNDVFVLCDGAGVWHG